MSSLRTSATIGARRMHCSDAPATSSVCLGILKTPQRAPCIYAQCIVLAMMRGCKPHNWHPRLFREDQCEAPGRMGASFRTTRESSCCGLKFNASGGHESAPGFGVGKVCWGQSMAYTKLFRGPCEIPPYNRRSYIHMYVYIHFCMYTYIYIYIHMYTHAYTEREWTEIHLGRVESPAKHLQQDASSPSNHQQFPVIQASRGEARWPWLVTGRLDRGCSAATGARGRSA